MSLHNPEAILKAILEGYRLPVWGSHGLGHWARVYEIGQRLAERLGADAEVVGLFAWFHDARRVNEFRDDGHGMRGGELARSLRGRLVHLDDTRFERLYEACRRHTDGETEGDPTLLACWDSDRLDLGRVGMIPKPKRLCTDAARELTEWAHARAREGVIPWNVLKARGVSPPHSGL